MWNKRFRRDCAGKCEVFLQLALDYGRESEQKGSSRGAHAPAGKQCFSWFEKKFRADEKKCLTGNEKESINVSRAEARGRKKAALFVAH